MEVQAVLFAEEIIRHNTTKYDIIGTYNDIFSAGFPNVAPIILVYVRLVMRSAEFGRTHKMQAFLASEDGERIAGIDVDAVMPDFKGKMKAGFNMRLEFQNVPLMRQGTYEFTLFMNDDMKACVSFDVLPMSMKTP